jgi:soluble lytic murein transglycosylase-like protein
MPGRRGRLSPPPWERYSPYPRHPTGPARRRFPLAYDGEVPEGEVPPRYRRAHDRDARARGRPVRRRAALDTLRRSPVRNGLIGLAVAGSAAPVAVNRYQQALRTDPSHENVMTHGVAPREDTDSAVTDLWNELETGEQTESRRRESTIAGNITRYADYGLGRELAETIYDVAVANDIDPEVAFGLVRAESSFRNTSTSPVGAVGLTQLMPRTASSVEPGVSRAELRNPSTNLRIGFKYLRSLIDKYEGDTDLALLAYNRGPGTVDRELRNGRDPDNGYADFVHDRPDHGHTLYSRNR